MLNPLGRGVLTGPDTGRNDLPEGDHRLNDPRRWPDIFAQNLLMIDAVHAIVTACHTRAAPIALIWLPVHGDSLLPTPTRMRRVAMEDSMQAADLVLTTDDVATLDPTASRGGTAGPRYGTRTQAMTRPYLPREGFCSPRVSVPAAAGSPSADWPASA